MAIAYRIASTTPGRSYWVRREAFPPPGEDHWHCPCQGYTYHSRRRLGYECRHIKAARAALQGGVWEVKTIDDEPVTESGAVHLNPERPRAMA